MTLSRWAVLSVAATLAGCSTLSPEAARRSAETLYSARSGVPAGAGIPQNGAASVEGLLATLTAKPLDGDSSVRVALLHSVRIQSIYAQLGFARADLYDATRLSNPVLGYVRLTGGDAPPKTDWSLSQNFTELLFLRFRRNSAESGMQLAEQRVARELMEVEADVRTAYYRYAASNMILTMRERVARTTQVSATYAQQLFEAGIITALQRARLQEAADLAKSDQLRAFATKTLHRNALLTLLGYASNDAAPQITGQLSIPASISPEASGLKSWALANRLDLLSAREALRGPAL